MKKLFCIASIVATLVACGDNKTTTGPEAAPNTPGMNNTSGNIPDTTKGIRLNQPLKTDSSGLRDSTPR